VRGNRFSNGVKYTAPGDNGDIRRVVTGRSGKAFTKSVNTNYDNCNLNNLFNE
jgi:hypothetical protein